ncbi:uncharacterized protein [Palaemon carinicauda]|uniref:uncharacterized protein n=1 Tax=Palaemon carinicauda TaxID=392227 RepID=UPI0035B61D3C
MTGSSRETLSLETCQSAASVSFGKRNGWYVSRSMAIFIGLLFVSATIATALLVYYYAPNSQAGISSHESVSVSTSKPPATTASVSGEDKPEAKPYVRLPRSIKPLHYVVKLQPFINGNFSIMGYVEIEMEAVMSTDNITVHMTDISTRNDTIKLVAADNRQGPSLGIKGHSYDNLRQFYVANLSEPLQAGKKYVLSMEFEGYLNDKLYGLYRSTYTTSEGKKVLLASTQFQPTDARRAFPCLDEPGLKATFDVYLGRETNMSSLSNMPKYETMPIDGQPGWFWDHFNTSVPTSTYLVAFVISDFSHMNSTQNDHVLFRVWAREEAIKQANYALRSGPAILTFFEDYFKVPFPLPKSDMIAIPDFSAGAMENWGLITYRETAMLYDPAVSSASNKQRVLQVVAHELAHQWFGNLVTPEWWTDLWLNEGFASFMEYVGSDSFEPSWNMMQQSVIEDVQSVFGLDCLESSHPISIPVNHPDEINEIFDRISYSKGSSIIRMMSYFLTPSTFTKGLSKYLTTLKYKNAEQDDLWRFLTDAGHEDKTLPGDITVKTVMDTWTLQMGYPVIKVERSPSGTSASVTQERFLLVKNINSTDTHDYKWWVPLTYTSRENPNFEDTRAMAWMNNTQSEITIDSLPDQNNWVIFNLQETGYYRVNYDDNNWNLIIHQLQTDYEVIHVINRAQIIDDALDLARAGQLSYSIAMSINEYLSEETEYLPWAAVLNNMGYLDNMLSRSTAYGSFKKYMLNLLIPLYKSVGFEDRLDDPHLTQLKRVKALLWACDLGHKDCVSESVALYRLWMNYPKNTSIISPNVKSVVYCTAISEGGEKEWNFAWEQYLDSNVASEKSKLLGALGCSKEIWIISRYMKMAFTADSGIRKQDAAVVFSSVARNKVGRYLAWNYLRDNWKMITEYYGSGLFGIARLITATTGKFSTELELKELELFKEEYKDSLKTATRAVDQAIERTSNNIEWSAKNYDVITDWLKSNGYSNRLRNNLKKAFLIEIFLTKMCLHELKVTSRLEDEESIETPKKDHSLILASNQLTNISLKRGHPIDSKHLDAMTGSSRETLSLETCQSAASVSFGKRNGWYVSRSMAIFLGLLFVSATIATALLVYYIAPKSQAGISSHESVSVSTSKPPATTASASGEDKPEAKPYVRLPRSIKPLHYVVKLQPFINGNFSIMGYVEIEMEAVMSTDNITVHMTDIRTRNDTIKLVAADNRQGPSLGIESHSYDNVRQFYVANLSEPLQAGKKYVLSMEFEGYLNDKLYGLYRSTYTTSEGKKVLLASTQFQPTDARRAFPCLDEPGLKATFDVYLGRETNMSSLSNMPRYETMPIDGQPGWFWDHFNTSVPTSTYLVAFVISDFSHMNSTANDHVLFRVWAREEAIKQANYALRSGPAILTFFEDYFKVPFPLPKSDMIAIPDFSAGAMENWGLITYRETAMLYDPAVSSASNKQRVLQVVAHELAHQWFGNLVTPEWWTDLWLNEGFASFMEYVGSNSFEPSWNMMQQTVIEDVQSVFGLDCLESSHPISIPVNHPDEINEIFDRISYSKGSSIIRMMSYFLTPSTFTKGLSKYLTTLKYKNAEQDDLWRFLTDAGHEDNTLPGDITVKTVMDTWTLQMGYPVIKVERSPSGTSASVTQERFLLVKNINSTDTHDYKWWVPLTYTSRENPNFEDTRAMAWMNNTQSEITIDSLPDQNKWVIFNLQETGYYRVNYDDNNWNLIIHQLQTDYEVIHVINRAQIIDDALDLARAGQLSYSIAMSINAYLKEETEYIPWAAVLNNMGYLDNMLSRSTAYGSFKKYMLDLLIPLYDSVGFEDRLDDPHLTQLKRVKALLWACDLGHKDCVSKSVALYRLWMDYPKNTSIISPNVKSVVYCTAISEGGEKEWNFAWEQYLDSNVASEKSKLLGALGCSKEIWIISRYMKMAFTADSGIRKQDAAVVFSSVARNKVGRYLAWNYLRDNWKMITDYYGSGLFGIARLITATTGKFSTELELKELELFKEEYKDSLKTATRAVDQAIERTSNNIEWSAKNYDVITDWLKSNGYSNRLRNN